MKKAVIYGRVSTKDKQDYGRQLHDLNKYADANQYKVVETFSEKISGAKRTDQRKEYMRMLEYLNANPDVKNVLVTELSRFDRLGTKTKMAIEELAEKGINLFFQDRGINSLDKSGKPNSDTMMIIGILCDFAKKELETLKQRIKSGLSYSASNGGSGGGAVRAYGFKNENKKLAVDKEEAKVIKEMFELYQKGLGTAQIAGHLNSKGIQTRYQKAFGDKEIKTRGGLIKKGSDFSWSDATIVGILKNSIYKGERKYNGEILKIQPLVDPIVFDQVQIMLKNRNNRPIRAIKNDNYLKGLIKCGKCGQPFYMHQRKVHRDSAYKCLSLKLQYSGKMDYCGTPSIGIEKLLGSLFIVANSQIMTNVSIKKNTGLNVAEKIELKKIQIKNIKNDIKKFENKLDDLVDFLTDGTITKTQFKKKKDEYQAILSNSNDQLSSALSELALQQQGKKRPARNFYTQKIFQENIKEAISNITINEIPPTTKNNLKKIYTTKNDVMINVKVFDLFGDVYSNYVLSRWSKKMSMINHMGKCIENFDMSMHPIFHYPY